MWRLGLLATLVLLGLLSLSIQKIHLLDDIDKDKDKDVVEMASAMEIMAL